MEKFHLKGKTAIVIGGSKGLGFGMATGLAEAGADVVLSSRNQADLDRAAKEIGEKTGADVMGIAADITSIDGIEALVEKVVQRFDHIDILLNGAGLNIRKSVLEFEEADWDKVQDVQLKYVFFMCQAVARHMVEKKDQRQDHQHRFSDQPAGPAEHGGLLRGQGCNCPADKSFG